MPHRSTALNTLALVLVVGLIASAWLSFGPRQLGGQATYAVIQGTSMEPMLHANDLAIVRAKGRYEVGDVVAYRSAELDRLVLHRIVERDAGHFILKGDNNDFLDSARPTTQQIAGELALHVPKAGQLLQRLRSPAGLLILLGLGGIVVRGGRRRRAASGGEPDGAGNPGPRPLRSSLASASRSVRPEQLQRAIGLAGGAIALLALVSVVAFSRASVETVESQDLYEQTGTFSYAAEVAESPAYDSTTVTDGQAIFTSLVNEIDFSFDYRLNSDVSHSVDGTASLAARVTDGKGLVRTLPIAESQPFSGDTTTLGGSLALRELESLIARIEDATGATSDSYFVTLAARVDLSGMIGGAAIVDSFAPEVVFRLDATRLALAQSDVGDDGAKALSHTQRGSGPETVAATFRILGFEPHVDTVRRTSVFGALLAAVALMVLLGMRRLRHAAEQEEIAAPRDSSRALVANGEPSDACSVSLADMDDLIRVAIERGQLVLQRDRPDRTQYFVDDGSVRYEYSVTKPLVESSDVRPTGDFASNELRAWLPLAARFSRRRTPSARPKRATVT